VEMVKPITPMGKRSLKHAAYVSIHVEILLSVNTMPVMFALLEKRVDMKLKQWMLFCLVTIILSNTALSQKTLFLGNPGKNRKQFFIGDTITLIDYHKNHITGKIRYMLPDKVGVGDKEVMLDSVKKVVFEGYYRPLRLKGINIIAGTFALLTLDVLNRKINRYEKAFDAQNLGVTTVLVAIGSLMLPWNDKKVRVNDRRPLRVVDFD